MDRSHERLRKYETDVEAHLHKVETAMDEEINNLKKKIKDVKETLDRNKSQEITFEKQVDAAQHESKSHENALDNLAREREEKERRLEETHRQMIEDERMTKELESENEEMREELDKLAYGIKQLELNFKSLGLEGDEKGFRQKERRMEEVLEKLEQKKAAQDSSIRRLRKDTRFVEAALQRVEERMLEEVRKQQSQSDHLDRKVGIFARERVDAVDEFQNILKHLNNDENGDVKGERKAKAVDHNTALLYLILKNDCDRITVETKKQRPDTQKMERSNAELKKKFENLLSQYEELRKSKADGAHRDFSIEGLAIQEQKKLLRERFSQREKEVDELFDNYHKTKIKFKRNRMDRRNGPLDGSRLLDLKKELIAATRRETALKAKLVRIVEKNEEMQEELSRQRKILEQAANEVKKIDNDVPEKDEIKIDSVTVSTEEDKLKTVLERKEAELEEIVERLQISNQKERYNLQTIKDNLFTMNSRFQSLAHKRHSPAEDALDLRKEIKHLKQEESALNKTIAQLQREMQLSLIRREAAVGKAQSVVPLSTNIKGERMDELDALRRRVAEKRKELEEILVE